MTNLDTPPALCCVPGAIAASERVAHFTSARRLFDELAQERHELENGYAFGFRAGELESIAQFIANERKCCPFLDFELTVSAGGGPVRLRMTGPAGAREVLKSEFDGASSRSCC